MSRKTKSTHKAASIYDVAREARVSVFTVSAVVNKKKHVGKKLQERVEAAIRRLNYRPNLLARSLAKQRTHTIGMIIPDIANPFFPIVVRGAEDAAQKHGYNLLLCNSDDSQTKEENALEVLLAKRVDGILLTKIVSKVSPSLHQMMQEMKVPIVLMMRTAPDISKDAVVADDYQGAYDAVCHLASVGRKRIGLLAGPGNVSNSKARWQGYCDALEEKGLAYDPELVIRGDYRMESGYRVGKVLLARQPDALYVANFLMTVGLLRAAEESGLRCPEDFGLVSFEDYPWLAISHPRLTAVEPPKYELGQEAVELLMERIAGKTGRGVLKKLKPELRVRESCGYKATESSQLRNAESAVPTKSV
ncbi:MAG TPA: LacI family DNA-binding transcriptional regulator [Candidatus Eremiobacteraceae bacterium]|nr:LacI family DNA-binding transcriptional regulator [Candidatus Eremiobacteraceae bacterium]